jgi:glycosyltransferase involved in cell wall biosynthesis
MPFLTIAIPTFNRNEKASKQLAEVLRQVKEGMDVEILVLDNASTVPLSETLAAAGFLGSSIIRIEKNPVNVGLGANISRCFELAAGDWVWLVGDDDRVVDGALDEVLAALHRSGNSVIFHKFAVQRNNSASQRDCRVEDLDTLCRLASDPWFYSNLMFISTTVIRRQTYAEYMVTAMHWNYSVAPHLAVVFAALRDGSHGMVWSFQLAAIEPMEEGQRWSETRLRMGLQSLQEIEGCEKQVHALFSRLMKSWHGGWKAPFITPLICLRSSRPSEFWRAWYFRAAASTGGFYGLVNVVCAVFWVPLACSRPVRRVVKNHKGLRDDNAGISRT